jgi:hypothetical protein
MQGVAVCDVLDRAPGEESISIGLCAVDVARKECGPSKFHRVSLEHSYSPLKMV